MAASVLQIDNQLPRSFDRLLPSRTWWLLFLPCMLRLLRLLCGLKLSQPLACCLELWGLGLPRLHLGRLPVTTQAFQIRVTALKRQPQRFAALRAQGQGARGAFELTNVSCSTQAAGMVLEGEQQACCQRWNP